MGDLEFILRARGSVGADEETMGRVVFFRDSVNVRAIEYSRKELELTTACLVAIGR